MLIGGLQKTTLIDYPGKVACTVFLVGCNFRCPFCHNRDLVTLELFKKSGIRPISEKDFFDFLKKRKRILDGVCITGGEPCINKDLPEFIKKIKKIGLLVKLDTNGSNPEMLEKLIKEKLIDFVAMDVKTVFSEYEKAIKVKSPRPRRGEAEGGQKSQPKAGRPLVEKVKSSIGLILKSRLPYEFRTTVVPGIHDTEVMVELANQMGVLSQKSKVPAKGWSASGRKSQKLSWVLQQFRPQNCLDKKFLKIKPYSRKEMKDILKAVKKILPGVKIRGDD